MNFDYPKSVRLRKKRQYQRVAHNALRHIGEFVIIESCPTQFLGTRLGVTVSRRYGKAHLRNRFKRIIREAFRSCRHLLALGFDLNVKPRNASYSAKTQDIQKEMVRLLTNLKASEVRGCPGYTQTSSKISF